MNRYLFAVQEGTEPMIVGGPYRYERGLTRGIVAAMQRLPKVAAEEGTETLFWLEIPPKGRPRMGAFVNWYMDELRERARRGRPCMIG